MSKITIGSNINSLRIQRNLAATGHFLNRTLERLSSGSRLNRASDDAAGIAISSGLSTSARVYTQGIRNINDGLSALNIAEGSARQLTDVLTRLKELAVQASSGSISNQQRRSLDQESMQLTNEYNRIVGSVKFNGLSLLNGSLQSMRIQSEFGDTGGIGVALGQGLQRSTGTGSFTMSNSTAVSNVVANAIGDTDGDGDTDVVVVVDDGFLTSATTYLNDGRGNFTSGPASILAGGSLPILKLDVNLIDINSDGRLDLVTSFGSNSVSFFSGDGSGAFSTLGSTALTSNAGLVLEPGDFNGDGKPDFLAVGSAAQDRYAILLNNGLGGFTVSQQGSMDTAGGYDEFAVGDINGDGYADIVNANATALGIQYGNGAGLLGSVTSVNASNTPVAVRLADMNLDGLLDIVAADSAGATFFKNSGGGSFTASSIGLTGSASGRVRLVDINGDGYLDVARGSQAGTSLQVAFSNGQGTFTVNAAQTVVSLSEMDFADFTGDGVVDLLALTSGNFVLYSASTTSTTNVQRINLTTKSDALASLSVIDAMMRRVQDELGTIGYSQSRLGTALNALSSKRDAVLSADSRVRDTDVATDVADLTRRQILQNLSSSLLAQANQAPTIALDLLLSA